tara:strand:+ start:121 stop:516 length:396 start_codon:yes stop_codon:yes gene_type:complete
MKKCPCCGYQLGKKYNPSMEIISLLAKRDKITKNMINQACSYIQSEVPSDDNITKRFQFIQGISQVEDESIQYMIARFVLHKLYMQGYGYSYLRSMIIREHNDSPRKKLNELKRYGKPPKIRKKEKDNAET